MTELTADDLAKASRITVGTAPSMWSNANGVFDFECKPHAKNRGYRWHLMGNFNEPRILEAKINLDLQDIVSLSHPNWYEPYAAIPVERLRLGVHLTIHLVPERKEVSVPQERVIQLGVVKFLSIPKG